MVDRTTSRDEQIRLFVELLHRLAKEEDTLSATFFFGLVKEKYKIKWTKADFTYFACCYEMFTTYCDYFFSYTDRPSNVNRNYRSLIKDILGAGIYDKAVDSENLLARAIYTLIEKEKPELRGFYYREGKLTLQNIMVDLRDKCKKTFVFIQLVQNAMFTGNKSSNYAFLEWEAATNPDPHKKRAIFVQAEPKDGLVKKTYVPFSYEDWYRHISDTPRTVIEFTVYRTQAHIEAQKDTIRREVLNRIEELKWEMINKHHQGEPLKKGGSLS